MVEQLKQISYLLELWVKTNDVFFLKNAIEAWNELNSDLEKHINPNFWQAFWQIDELFNEKAYIWIIKWIDELDRILDSEDKVDMQSFKFQLTNCIGTNQRRNYWADSLRQSQFEMLFFSLGQEVLDSEVVCENLEYILNRPNRLNAEYWIENDGLNIHFKICEELEKECRKRNYPIGIFLKNKEL